MNQTTFSSIKAIIIKETRENLRWAVLVCLITVGVLAQGLSQQPNMGMSLLGSTFLALCMITYPAAGLSLGLLQVFQDSGKGRWQFISHRPISRSWMLICKAMVGIILYLVATLIPLFVAAFWSSMPRHVSGPFAWDMLQPALAYLLWGLIWYMVGLLIATRRARWFGSRFMPLGGAVAGSFASYLLAWKFSESLFITLFASAIVFIGTLGVFRTGGESQRSPVWSKPSIGLSVWIGLMLLVVLGMALGDGAIRTVFPRPTPNDQPQKTYHLGSDGQVQIWTFEKNSNGVESAQSLTGQPLKTPPRDYWSYDQAPTANLYVPEELTGERTSYPSSHNGFLQPSAHVIPLGNQWFHVVSQRALKKYNSQTYSYLGSLGPNGFRGPMLPVQPFSQTMRYLGIVDTTQFLTCDNAVYRLDLARNNIEKIYSATPGDPVFAVASSTEDEVGKMGHQGPAIIPFTVVATRSSLHIFDDDKPPFTVPVDKAAWQNRIEIERAPNGRFVIAYGLDWPVGTMKVSVCTYDPDGKLVNRLDVPADHILNRNDDRFDLEEFGALTLSPPLFFPSVYVARGRVESIFVPWHVIALMISTALIFPMISLVMLRARHATRTQFCIWLTLATALGLTGILLLMSMFEKPRSIKCASCGKRRLVTEDACKYCRKPAELPTMHGTEILDMPELVPV